MGELLQVNRCLKVSRQARDVLLAGDGEGLLKVFANKLASQEYIENEISRCILSEDEMADNASPVTTIISGSTDSTHLKTSFTTFLSNVIVNNPQPK